MYAENNDFPDRPDALPLGLIWGFETTSTNSTGSGQDDPGAALLIFLFIAQRRAVLTGPVHFRFYKKGLDPLIKYYNNQTNRQKSR